MLMMLTNKRKERCQLAVSPGLRAYPSLALQYPFSIGSPYARIFSKYINLTFLLTYIFFVYKFHLMYENDKKMILIRIETLMWDVGMIPEVKFKLPSDCRVDKPLEAITRKLTLVDLSPAFVILGVGISAPEVAQFTEKIDTNGPRVVKNRPSHNKELTDAFEVVQSTTKHYHPPMTMQIGQNK